MANDITIAIAEPVPKYGWPFMTAQSTQQPLAAVDITQVAPETWFGRPVCSRSSDQSCGSRTTNDAPIAT